MLGNFLAPSLLFCIFFLLTLFALASAYLLKGTSWWRSGKKALFLFNEYDVPVPACLGCNFHHTFLVLSTRFLHHMMSIEAYTTLFFLSSYQRRKADEKKNNRTKRVEGKCYFKQQNWRRTKETRKKKSTSPYKISCTPSLSSVTFSILTRHIYSRQTSKNTFFFRWLEYFNCNWIFL